MKKLKIDELQEINRQLEQRVREQIQDNARFVEKLNYLVVENGKLRATIKAIEQMTSTIAQLSRQEVNVRE